MRRKAYASVAVNHVELKELNERHRGADVMVGLDVGKKELIAVCRWFDGQFERPWAVANPGEIETLVSLLRQLSQGRTLTVAMESSGTYGDAVRYALSRAEVHVRRVSSKASHDYAEIFDGVPSQHDGKDAAVIAELAALGKSSLWPFEVTPDWEEELHYWVEHLELNRKTEQPLVGSLEALLSRHWPEATEILPLSSGTLMRALAHYGAPAGLGADAAALARLQKWGGKYLKAAQAQALLTSAKTTLGVPAGEWTQRRLQEVAAQILETRRAMARSRRQLQRLAQGHEILKAQGAVVGLPTACVLWSCVGDPRAYDSAGAYRKAMGLNLVERSSGQHQGKLRLSKRGPSRCRQWLYFAVLRLVQQTGVSQWYQAKKARDAHEAKRALVAVMRRLVLALYGVGVRRERFEAHRLFPRQRGVHGGVTPRQQAIAREG
jgi:transposase